MERGFWMSWFNVNAALTSIRNFLQRWSSLITNLNNNVRPSSIFECFSFISIVEAYDSNGYSIQRRGPQSFFFKRSTRGIPNNYTYFLAAKENEEYEIRLNQSYENASSIHFNLDVTISNGRDSLNRGILTHQNIHSFCECKHYRTFYPSTCANFIGLSRLVMPQNILWAPTNNYHPYPPPALLVSGNASPDVFKLNNLVRIRNYHVRFFDNISPYGGNNVLRSWV